MNKHPLAFWGLSTTEMLQQLQAAKEGLTAGEAGARLARYGSNLLKPSKRSDVFTLLLAQFKNPLILILFFATGLSFFLHEPVDAFIILAILLVSGLLGFWQERGASNAVEKLLSIVRIKAAVLRDGRVKEIPVEEIVPGDIVVLNFPRGKSGCGASGRDADGPADKRSLDGDARGERQRKGARHQHRQGNRVRQTVREAKTQAAGNGL